MESTINLDSSFRTLMEASNDAFSVVDGKSGQFLAINRSFSRLFDYNLQELNELDLGTFYGISDKYKTIKRLQNAARFEIFVCNVKVNNGNSRTIELSSSPIRLNEQDYLLLLHRTRSQEANPFIASGILSIEQAYNESEAKWRAITENSPDHIMIIDTNGIILYINHTVPNLTVEQVIGKSCYEFSMPEQIDFLKETYSKAIISGKPIQFDTDYQAGDTTLYFDNRVWPISRDGTVTALLVASRDITDRFKTLKQLEKSQQHLYHALKAGKTGTWDWGLTTNEVTWSEGVEAMFGMEPGSFQGSYEAYRKLVHPDDIPIIESAIGRAISSYVPYYVEHRCIFPDGTTHWLSGQGEVYRDESGTPIRMIGTVTDITQRKIDEQRITEQEFLLAKSQEIAHIGSYSWDIKTNKFYWSDEMHRIFGISKQEFDGNGAEVIAKAIHPDDQERIYQAQQYILQEKKSYPLEYRVVRPDGTNRYVWADGYLNLDKNGELVSMVGTVQDITERKKAEAALLESQQKLAMHLQHTPLGVIDWNLNNEILEWNPSAETIFGYSRQEALGKSAFSLIVSDTVQPQLEPVWKELVSNEGGYKKINENITKDGRTIICEWYNTPLVDEKGKVIGVSSLVQDITDRVRAQEELEKHRLHLEELVKSRTEEIHEQALIIDQIHDSVVSTDLDGIVKSWNKGAEKMFGFSANQVIGKNISIVYPKDKHDFLFNEILPQLKEKGELETEIEVQRKNGERFYALLSLSVKHDLQGSPSGLIGYTIDITDRKRYEEKILRQQKELEAANKELEAFSYSVSHDLRSPLRSIDGFSAALLEDYYDLLDDEGKEYFQRIRKSAQRMADLIDNLLQLSRVSRHHFKKEPINLSLMALDIIQKYKDENPDRDIEIEIEDNLNVEGDPGLLWIALDNLISNAWKYTAKTPSPKIQLYRTELDGVNTYCIKDNGVGFDMRYVNKLFGAFQRLHAADEFSGMGIGLATVSRIISRHGGRIWAEGVVNKGATFCFTLGEH